MAQAQRQDTATPATQATPGQGVVAAVKGVMTPVEAQRSQNQTPGPGTPVSSNPEKPDRVTVMSRLRPLALASLMYANDHKGSLASDVAELRPYLGNEDQFTWIAANVEYLGKGAKRNEGASPAVRPLAYWRTPTTTDGTVVAFLDGHVEYVNADRLAKLGIVISVPAAGPQGTVQMYEVNRVVADFPPTEDMSTPEAAYATINRIDRNDPSAWQKVSIAALAERFAREGSNRRTAVDPEWVKVLLQARIREVVIWNLTRAAVIAELPQGLSGKKVVQPIDVRSLQLENGRWLNTGNDRYASIEQAKAAFLKRMERQSSVPEAMRDPLAHADEIKAAAAQLFERLRTADYADILLHYRDGKFDSEGWKKFPTHGLYMVHTDYPSFALWCCTHFKDNPIVQVRLGEVFIGNALVIGKTGWPTVPYKLTLKDGVTLAGDLPFDYIISQGQGHWHGMEGIDWHLWGSGTK
jgi:prepilin-type processing-associated H-X9-DG protein